MKIQLGILFLMSASLFTDGQSLDRAATTKMKSDQNITVLELRNYRLKPKTVERFRDLFNGQFVEPMNELNGYTVGQFRIENDEDRFIWMRGFADMRTRFKFLNDFYLNSQVWKKYRSDANSMIINSDNVYLLRPLTDVGKGYSRERLQNNGEIVVVDFYVCNSTLDQVIELFRKQYLPFLESLNVSDVTVWVSEMTENDFPRLPVFQDKNLLVTMTRYKNEREYRQKSKQIKMMPAKLDTTMQELITTSSLLELYPVSHNQKNRTAKLKGDSSKLIATSDNPL